MQTDFAPSAIAWQESLKYIAKHGPFKGHSGSFELPCPVCKAGIVFVSVAFNCHTYGKCRNKDCKVSWIE